MSKDASKGYSSCASHILSFCFISVSGLSGSIEIPFLVIEQTRHCMKNNQREITHKYTSKSYNSFVHDTSSHCAL